MPAPRPSPRLGSAKAPTGSPTPSRASSAHNTTSYASLNPSQLRISHEPGTSPEHRTSAAQSADGDLHVEDNTTRPVASEPTSPFTGPAHMAAEGGITEPSSQDVDAHTRLLQSYNDHPNCGLKSCNHGTFSPRPTMRRSYFSYDGQSGIAGSYGRGAGDSVDGGSSGANGGSGDTAGDWTLGGGKGKRMSTTQVLARRHGVKNPRRMYVSLGDILHLETRNPNSVSKIW